MTIDFDFMKDDVPTGLSIIVAISQIVGGFMAIVWFSVLGWVVGLGFLKTLDCYHTTFTIIWYAWVNDLI